MFSEPQIHDVLKTTAVETVKSLLHAMRSLVLLAVYGGGKQTPGQFRKALFRGASPARGASTSSEGETESEGYTTDKFTSGAITSDGDNVAMTASVWDSRSQVTNSTFSRDGQRTEYQLCHQSKSRV